MEERTTLDRLKVGQSATVVDLELSGIKRRRLQDLGFIKGGIVRAEYESPAGNPVAYLIRGTVLALRKEDAGKIQILLPEDGGQ